MLSLETRLPRHRAPTLGMDPLRQRGLSDLPIFQKQAQVSSLEAVMRKSAGLQGGARASFSLLVVKF